MSTKHSPDEERTIHSEDSDVQKQEIGEVGLTEKDMITDGQEVVLEEDDFPDGGWRAWFVVLGVRILNSSGDGQHTNIVWLSTGSARRRINLRLYQFMGCK